MGSYQPRHAWRPKHAAVRADRSYAPATTRRSTGLLLAVTVSLAALLTGLASPPAQAEQSNNNTLMSEPLAISGLFDTFVFADDSPALPASADNPQELRDSLELPPQPEAKPDTITETKPKKQAKPKVHTVKRGDTAYAIAKQHGQSLRTLLSRNKWAWNNIDVIHPGDKFRLSGKKVRVPSWVLNRGGSTASRSSSAPRSAPSTPPKPAAASSRAARVVEYAQAQLGKPYVWGAEGPNSFDCSGLTSAAARYAGVSIPRTASQQYYGLQRISKSQLRPGDLVFSYPEASGVGHVGIYIGGGQIINALKPGAGVVVSPMSWFPYAGAARL